MITYVLYPLFGVVLGMGITAIAVAAFTGGKNSGLVGFAAVFGGGPLGLILGLVKAYGDRHKGPTPLYLIFAFLGAIAGFFGFGVFADGDCGIGMLVGAIMFGLPAGSLAGLALAAITKVYLKIDNG